LKVKKGIKEELLGMALMERVSRVLKNQPSLQHTSSLMALHNANLPHKTYTASLTAFSALLVLQAGYRQAV
jgi:hypothetical protein